MNPIQILPFLALSFVQEVATQNYDFKHPNHSIELAEELKEISGIALSEDGELLYAIQDEAGKVYAIEEESGDIEAEIQFWKDGDYEDVALVKDEIFVLKSSGTLYQIQQLGQANQNVIKHNTMLNKEDNAEGLCYDALNNKLLIACKNAGQNGAQNRAVYAFDLLADTLQTPAIMHFEKKQFLDYIEEHKGIEKFEKIQAFLAARDFRFGPSAIAIHPLTSDFYVLSAVGNLLVILDKEGQIKQIIKLSKKIHRHPEGLAFTPSGVLYISNEGKGEQPAMIHRFEPN